MASPSTGAPPTRNKGVIWCNNRPYEGKPMVNKPLINKALFVRAFLSLFSSPPVCCWGKLESTAVMNPYKAINRNKEIKLVMGLSYLLRFYTVPQPQAETAPIPFKTVMTYLSVGMLRG